jgi:flagellar hook protein FlgE
MIDFSTPLSGLAQAETSVNQIAKRLASPASDTVGLSAEMVGLIQGQNNFATNVKVAETMDEMTKTTLSIFA